MDGRTAARIELAVDAGAAVMFAAAAAYACHALWAGPAVGAALGGSAAFALCFAALRKVERFKFRLEGPTEAATPVTDLLAEADRSLSERETAGTPDALILDDILAGPAPDSRVVRLFDVTAMPTSGEPEAGPPPGAPADASQALYDALADLRRSLN